MQIGIRQAAPFVSSPTHLLLISRNEFFTSPDRLISTKKHSLLVLLIRAAVSIFCNYTTAAEKTRDADCVSSEMTLRQHVF